MFQRKLQSSMAGRFFCRKIIGKKQNSCGHAIFTKDKPLIILNIRETQKSHFNIITFDPNACENDLFTMH